MAFTLYKKEKLEVEMGGDKIVVTYRPLTAMEAIQFGMKSERIKSEANAEDSTGLEAYYRLADLYLDLFSEVVTSIENVSDLPEGWSTTKEDKRVTIDAFGSDFLSKLIIAYSKKSEIPEEEIPK